jgi:hypothetical protein
MAEILLPCDTCLEPFPVKLTFGAGDETGFPVSVRTADYLAAYLEHALTVQETCHDRP